MMNERKNLFQFLIRYIFLFDKEGKKGMETASEEGILHFLHRPLGIFCPGYEWIIHVCLTTTFLLMRTYELLVGKDFHKGCNGGICRMGLWIATYDFVGSHALAMIP